MTSLTYFAVNKDMKCKIKLCRDFEILRFFNVLPNFYSTAIQTLPDYWLQTWYTQNAAGVAERFKIQGLSKLENLKKVSQLHRMTV